MTRRVFLSGPIGCGKSTLIKNALGMKAAQAGGFVTVRLLDEERLLGFELRPASSLACPEREREGRVFLSFKDGGFERDESVFTDYVPLLLSKASAQKFALIDETGGFELLLPEFRAALNEFFLSRTPCLGVLKEPVAAHELKKRGNLNNDYLAEALKLRSFIEADSESLILNTFGRGDSEAEAALAQWVSEYA